MPTYEYRCDACGKQYEKREGYDAPARQKCPKCGGKAQRVIHAPPIVFKGSGFYVTDSRKPVSGESEAPAQSSDDSSTSNDAAPAAGGSSTTDAAPAAGDSPTKDAAPAAAADKPADTPSSTT